MVADRHSVLSKTCRQVFRTLPSPTGGLLPSSPLRFRPMSTRECSGIRKSSSFHEIAYQPNLVAFSDKWLTDLGIEKRASS